MLEDWAAVGLAVRGRLAELRMQQFELCKRSKVSKATIREIQYGKARHRSPRTLQALSEALEWDGGHLQAILMGMTPQERDDKLVEEEPLSLASIEARLRKIERHLAEISGSLQRVFRA